MTKYGVQMFWNTNSIVAVPSVPSGWSVDAATGGTLTLSNTGIPAWNPGMMAFCWAENPAGSNTPLGRTMSGTLIVKLSDANNGTIFVTAMNASGCGGSSTGNVNGYAYFMVF